jgi:D-threo-aldose 1-dehydrogenase
VSELGLGAAPLGNLFEPITDEAARSTVAAAVDAGITYVDTAPWYGFGLSERRVGDFLRHRSRMVISTKVGRLLRPCPEVIDDRERWGFRSSMPFSAEFDYSFDGVMQSWEASLQRLGLARIDLLYVHDIGRATHGGAHQEKFRQLTYGGGLRALAKLRSDGAVGAIGIGVNEVEVCLALLQEGEFDAILLAGRYTLLEQDPLRSLFPQCAARGTSIVVGGPYNSGILATGTRGPLPPYFNYSPAPDSIIEKVRRIESICERYGAPLAAAALQFPLAHPQVVSVIPGLASASRLAETIEYYRYPVPREVWQTLKNEGLISADAPTPSSENRQCVA